MSEQEQAFVELIPGSQAYPRNKSMAHRLFFQGEKGIAPVKGDYTPVEGGEPEETRARLFTYHLEGPPYTLPQTGPALADLQAERLPTGYEVTAINAIHAREDVLAGALPMSSMSAYGPGIQILWDKLEEGCPEWPFGQAVTQAFAAYDAMVEACADYQDWEAKHGQFMATLDAEQRKAIFKHFGGGSHNVEMNLRFRAAKSDHWQEISKPILDAQTEAALAEAERAEAAASATKSLAAKFGELFESCTPEEREIMAKISGQALPTPEQLEALKTGGPFPGVEAVMQSMPHGQKVMSVADLVAAESAARMGEMGDDWIELQPGFQGFQRPMTHDEAAKDFAQKFPGFAQHFPGVGAPFQAGFAPGPGESFTLGDGQERDQRQLEAAIGESDTLRARLHADANERERKLGLFKDVVAGGLAWLLEKVEGAPEPVPAEPVGPVEQIMGRTGVNGGRASVMNALREQHRAFTPSVPSFPGVPEVGAPGEEF